MWILSWNKKKLLPISTYYWVYFTIKYKKNIEINLKFIIVISYIAYKFKRFILSSSYA